MNTNGSDERWKSRRTMNRLIHDYFDAIETRLIASPIVAAFDIIRREVTSTDGKIRIRATLTDGGLLEPFEYVVEDEGEN